VLIDEYDIDSEQSIGRTACDCPEIDAVVLVRGQLALGQFHKVEITGCSDYDLDGVASDEIAPFTSVE
ncbi:MAG: hypothetical protein ACE5IR_24405, partial [bacterium]